MRETVRYYMALVRETVDHMDLPRWYTREEGHSAGYLALVENLGQYETKKRKGMQCNVRTYVRNLVRYAVKREVRWLRVQRTREDPCGLIGGENE
jgi:hypothetical protein